MADLYFLPSGVPAPSRSWKYSPSTYHVKPGEFAIPAPSRSWKYSPSAQHVKGIQPIFIVPVVGVPNGLVLLQPFSGQSVLLGAAREVDIARGTVVGVELGAASETNTAPSINIINRYNLGKAVENDQVYAALVLQPGLGQVTRYITAELVDRNEVTRTNVYRDLINYSTVPDKVLFTTKGAADIISHSSHTDRIFFSRAA